MRLLCLALLWLVPAVACAEQIHLSSIPELWRTEIDVSAPVVVKPRGITNVARLGLLLYEVRAGRHRIDYRLEIDGKPHFLVEYIENDGASGRTTSNHFRTNVAGCGYDVTHYLAIGVDDRAIYPKAWSRTIKRCDFTKAVYELAKDWHKVRVVSAGDFAFRGFTSDAEAARASTERDAADRAYAQALEQTRTEQGAQDLPKKREIGAKLCRRDRSLIYIAFTEAVSPDNGKLKLRVVDAHYVGTPGLRPTDVREQILWDEPGNWTLCE